MCRFKKSVLFALVAAGFALAQNPLWENLYPAYNGVAFGSGRFVAVSGDGLVRATSNGGEWTQAFVRGNGWLNGKPVAAVAYGETGFVAVPNNASNYLQSGNGVDWGVGPMTVSSYAWKKIAFGELLGGWSFVAVDDEGYTALFDEDGWESGDAGGDMSHVAIGSGRVVVVGSGIKQSADAHGWGSTNISSSTQVAVVAFSGEKFVALAKNGSSVYTSSNGTTWETASASAAPNMADMAYGGGKFVAVGAAGKGCVSGDGTSWTTFTLNEADNFKAVAYGNNGFLALGAKGSVYKSENGTSWEKKAGHSVTSYKQIASGGGKFVAVGDSGASVSTDGKEWARSWGSKPLVGVVFGKDRFVAVGDSGTLVSSADGVSWNDHSVTDAVFTSVAFGNGVFIAGGREAGKAAAMSRAVIYTSADGQAWVNQTYDIKQGWPASGQHIVSLCFGDGYFLAAANGTKTLKKCDASGKDIGQYWTEVPGLPNEADGYYLTSVTFANGRFAALGTKASESVIVSAADAASASWSAVAIPSEIKWVRSAIYAKGTYIAVADSGNVYAQISNEWKLQPKATNRNLSTIYYSSEKNALLAAGAGGAMLYSAGEPVSVRHASAPRSAPRAGGAMRLERSGRAPTVTLSFTPATAGTVAVYSLSGRRLYKAVLAAGERSVRLPERTARNGSVLVRYSGDGRVVSQRFQVAR